MVDFKYLVVDFEGEPLKKFYGKQDAEWFINDKPDCKIIKLNFKSDQQIREEVFKQVGEAPF